MSKSSVFTLFGSKAALDMAVVDLAAVRFSKGVVTPADAAPPGIARIAALCEGFLAFATETGGPHPPLTPDHPAFGLGATPEIRARLESWRQSWRTHLAENVTEAIRRRELTPATDVDQVVFEIVSVLNFTAADVLGPRAGSMAGRARQAIERVLVAQSEDRTANSVPR